MSFICDILERRSIESPNRLAYSFISDRGRRVEDISNGELLVRVRALAASLRRVTEPQATVVCLLHPGLDFIAAFFACLWAGRIAVPVSPQRDPGRAADLIRLVADAGADVCLLDGSDSVARAHAGLVPGLRLVDVREPDDPVRSEPAPAAQDVAYLQYTSGSTGAPKGVMATHANLAANSAQICAAFRHTPDSVGVIWLPPYHDMGLVGGIVQPLYVGFPVRLMSPAEFLRSPLTWLRMIDRYRATTSGGPNFGYEQTVRRIAPEQRADLDLRSWTVAFCGAEPVSASTLSGFAEAFAPNGFDGDAFTPCYGLAESTLMVTCRDRRRPLTTEAPQSGAYVSCGPPGEGVDLDIVDPSTGQGLPVGSRGEIWVSGPSVSPGYWRAPKETEATFGARLPGRSGRYLRTGDVGFLAGGELFVCGRLRSIAIIRGRNIAFEDVERAAADAHPGLEGYRAAAFSAPVDGEEQLIVLQEAPPAVRNGPAAAEVAATIRERIAKAFGVQPHTVRLTSSSDIPKTATGKIRRDECRSRYLAGLEAPQCALHAEA